MEADQLRYSKISAVFAKTKIVEGLGESAQFLVWFLRNIYRLEPVPARDSVCDHPNDKGIDGIYVDDNEREIHLLQAKLRQKDSGTIGDKSPKELVGSLDQFKSREKIEAILAGNANNDLKGLLRRVGFADRVDEGYKLVAVYVTNERHDADSIAYEGAVDNLRIYGREEIAMKYVDLEPMVAKPLFIFETVDVTPLEMKASTAADSPTLFVFPVRALQLVHLEGIEDGSLFKENVRYTLGNTGVNKSISRSIADKAVHPDFVLFHNGVTILCSDAEPSSDGTELTIKNYSVVNGAQSLTSFHAGKAKLTAELKVLVRVVVVRDETLARTISENSNNQNAIKPRDLRSNDTVMQRLKVEVERANGSYHFEIKRGEEITSGATVISNDTIGRALLSFDLGEPWSAHQVYRVFDSHYADIFGRPEVGAARIIFLHHLLERVKESLAEISNRPMASYTLTRYFLLFVLAQIMRESEYAASVARDPAILKGDGLEKFLAQAESVLATVIVDLNYESEQDEEFDYKSVLKSPKQCGLLAGALLKSYKKDVARGKAQSFVDAK